MENNQTKIIIAVAQHDDDLLGPNIRMLGWNLPLEEQDLIHPHWRQYETPPYFMHLLLALIYFILMVTSATGNGLVLWIFGSSKQLRSTASNMLIMNMAVFDLLIMLEMPMFLANSLAERLLGYKVGCDIYAALGSLSGIGAAMNNAAIAYDRYRTISRPLDGKLSKTQGLLLCLFIWFWSLPFTIMPWLRIWGRFVPEGFLTTCSFDYLTDDLDTRVFTGVLFVWAYVIPMILICFNYFRLFTHVHAHEKLMSNQAKKMNVKSLASNKDMNATCVEIRIAKAAFTIFFLFVTSWTPYAFVAMTGAFGDKKILTPLATMIPAVFAKVVSCIDPWIYAASHPRYRKELEKRVPWLGIKESLPETVPEDKSHISEIIDTDP